MKTSVFLLYPFLLLVVSRPSRSDATRLLMHSEARNSAQIDPSIQQLQAMVADQQSKVGALQKELSGILNDVAAGKQAFQQSRANAAPGATVEIQFPGPPPSPGKEGAAAPVGAAAPPGSLLEGFEAPEMLPIPVMVVKPDSVADVEEAMTQVMEEQAAMNGAETAKNTEPIEMKVESPEEQLEEAISKIDKLEAEKTHYKYDMHSVQNSFSQ